MAELRFPSWLRLPLAQEGMLICFSTLLKGKVRDASASAQRGHKGGSGCSLSSKTSPFFPTFIVSPPVYLHTVFLDDFFWRSLPYTQAEAMPLWRTCGESSPLSKDTSRVCAQKARASSGVCQTLVVCERGPYVSSPLNGAVPG